MTYLYTGLEGISLYGLEVAFRVIRKGGAKPNASVGILYKPAKFGANVKEAVGPRRSYKFMR